MHWWFSGRILACHAGGPGSIPGQCSFVVPTACGPSKGNLETRADHVIIIKLGAHTVGLLRVGALQSVCILAYVAIAGQTKSPEYLNAPLRPRSSHTAIYVLRVLLRHGCQLPQRGR